MTLLDRAAAFAQAFPDWPAAWPVAVEEQGRTVLYARWLLGNDYRNKVGYYGEYPPGYLKRVMALFPDVERSPHSILHAFSGSLSAGAYARCDVGQPSDSEWPDLHCRVEDLPRESPVRWRLTIADPPYSQADAERYGTAMIDRRKVLAALAAVTLDGGYLCWLDTTWPMHSKRQWLTVARIAITRSTNHRIRDLTIFQRVANG